MARSCGCPSRVAEACTQELARISGRVRRDRALAQSWRERSTTEPSSIFESVCADLAVSFNERVAGILIRNVERRAKQVRPGQDVRAAVEALCAEEITDQRKRLPVPYYSVLDRLGLLGDQRARAALCSPTPSSLPSASRRGVPATSRRGVEGCHFMRRQPKPRHRFRTGRVARSAPRPL